MCGDVESSCRGQVRQGTRKIEIVCAACGGHIGHVFKSSRYPPPKRERHCVNSVSLDFIPAADVRR